MAAPQDDIAFRSQEYASQVNRDVEPARQRVQNATEGFAQSVGVGVNMALQGRQQGQRNMMAQRELDQRQQHLDIEKTASASALALDQVRQKRAEYELWFTQQLHNTKAIEAQRRMLAANADLAELNVDKLRKDVAGAWPRGISVEEMNYMVSKGRKWNFKTREFEDATPEDIAEAKSLDPAAIAKERIAAGREAEARKLSQGQEALEIRRAGDELDAITARIKEARMIRDKATREAKVQSLIEELDAWAKREGGAAPNRNGTPPAESGQSVGDKTYIDMLRSIPGGK